MKNSQPKTEPLPDPKRRPTIQKNWFQNTRRQTRPTLVGFIFLTLFVTLFLFSCRSDDESPAIPKTFDGNVELSTQAEVSAFAQDRVTHINGNLALGRTSGSWIDSEDPITDLSSLSDLITVDGDLIISRNAELTHLGGFDALLDVGGDLILSTNNQLTTAFGLNDLERIGGDLEISYNGSLNNLNALAGLQGVQNFRLLGNAQMERLFDMSSINDLNEVKIEGNASLISIAGLTNTSISDLSIGGNDLLENLQGLESTTRLNSLSLRFNESLKSVEGLQNLRSISSNITIEYNGNLEDLSGMGFLETGPFTMNIQNNPKLTSIDRFRMRNSPSNETTWALIENNNELKGIEPLDGLTSITNLMISGNRELIDLQPLSNLEVVSHLNVVANDQLENLKGLENLREAGILYVAGNSQLSSLDGLSSLLTVSNNFKISGNESLKDFCAITNLIDGGGVENEFDISFNAFNPSVDDLAAGNCSN